ncbi:MAG: FkbM family methyltransferase [Desulfobacterales bacterium]|jgi:FkbM family methyltransferase|nr:FkbM family methyltransferase [Desulfobacterales bacterium]MDP6808199.1 FkbM family methyltransferase [Desulfobacterales bacterium]|tara:strand:- start:23681 stop:24661 length:981 start_codon:yes stop_codon:yes gene_type:complete
MKQNLKIKSFLVKGHNICQKLIFLILPLISKVLVLLRMHRNVINRLILIRKYSLNRDYDYSAFIENLLNENKLTALDVGAAGGFNVDNIFSKNYEKFINPILVEPINSEARELIKSGFFVINKGLWSTKCNKVLFVTGKNPGGTSMYKPRRDGFELYNPDEEYYRLYEITEELQVECETISNSLKRLNVRELDYLKIDAQGAEYEILQGLGNYRPVLMRIEVEIVSLYKEMPCWTKLVEYLYGLNYMTCQWDELPSHMTQSPVVVDMLFIPNYLNKINQEMLLSRQSEFIVLMLMFGQIQLLKIASKKLKFKLDNKIQLLKEPYFH